jgi:ribosomal protein S18 acetylase RimI-like enzyme
MSLFFVAPSVRRRGVGRLMLDRFVAEMQPRGLEWCRIHTSTNNIAAQTVQEPAGFLPVIGREANLYLCAGYHRPTEGPR